MGQNLIYGWISNYTEIRFQNRTKLFVAAIVLLIFGFTTAIAQNQNQNAQFTFGAFFSHSPSQGALDAYDSCGMKTVRWYTNDSTENLFLHNYNNVMACNNEAQDWIDHYATGYYSKWESEENQTDTMRIGVKHILHDGQIVGQPANWLGTSCWSTSNLTGPADSLVYGPNYYQAKHYRRALYYDTLKYTARFHLAFQRGLPQNYNLTDPVCRIKVVVRFSKVYPDHHSVWTDTVMLGPITLTVGDFPDSSFHYFDFGNQSYKYPSLFPTNPFSQNPWNYSLSNNSVNYIDILPGQGVEFCVDWLGNSSMGTLYVDNTEVYDAGPQGTWSQYIDPFTRPTVINRIQSYANSHSIWGNVNYWYVHDEPHSLDAFTPLHIVDSLVHAVQPNEPLIQMFWEAGTIKNGDSIYNQYYRMAKPYKLMFDGYPFRWGQIPASDSAWDKLRSQMQLSYSLQPGFFYVAQAWGVVNSGDPDDWRRPDSSELKATVMLALSHGSKGVMFSDFDTHGATLAVVETDGTPTPLW